MAAKKVFVSTNFCGIFDVNPLDYPGVNGKINDAAVLYVSPTSSVC